MHRRNTLTVVVALAAACDAPKAPTAAEASSEPAAPRAPATAAHAASAEPDAASPHVSRCQALKNDNSVAILRVVSGDALVLDYDPEFAAADAVAKKAIARGATRAARTVFENGALAGNEGVLIDRVFTGMGPETLAALAPYLASGKLPTPNAGVEVLLSEDDARDAGLAIGDTVKLAFRDTAVLNAPARTWGPITARLCGTLRVSPHFGVHHQGVWMTYADLESAHPNHAEPRSTSIAISLPNDIDRAKWTRELAADLGSRYHVLTQEELNPTLLQSQVDALALCDRAAPVAGPTSTSLPVATCSDRAAYRALDTLWTATLGDVAVLAELGDLAALNARITAAQPDIDHSLPVLSLEGWIYDQATQQAVVVQGVTDLTTLHLPMQQGALGAVDATGGVAMDAVLASSLGLRVGARVALSLRIPAFQPATPNKSPWVHAETSVAAIFDGSLRSPHAGVVYADARFLADLHPDIPRGHTNILRIWAKPGRASAIVDALSAESKLLVSNTADEATTTTSARATLLDALCP